MLPHPSIKLPRISLRIPTSRALQYGYSNARVKAMKGLILPPSLLAELVRVPTVGGMVEMLQRTHYREELGDLALRYQGAQLVELSAQRRYIKLAQKVLRICPSRDRAVLLAILKKWDLLVLRMILNARQTGKKLADIQPYITPVSPGLRADFERIAVAEDPLAAFRKTLLGQEILKSGMSGNLANRSRKLAAGSATWGSIQQKLERYAYTYPIQTLLQFSGPDIARVSAVLRKEVDIRNAIAIEKLKRRGMPATEIRSNLIEGGSLAPKALSTLAQSKTPEASVAVLRSHFRQPDLPSDSLPSLETALEKVLAKEKLRAFHRSILSIGTLMGALLVLEEEVHNLRKIAKGKEFGLPEDEVRSMLVTI